ncbi:uroporphyrinogen-III C-methyltransferase [Rhodopila sp.]|uniref:uroporphyrinogen-III C-methyltransferase n=1 Tax=Rhodopila sp. TaxID=2480087 RepID=UPI003D12F1B6
MSACPPHDARSPAADRSVHADRSLQADRSPDADPARPTPSSLGGVTLVGAGPGAPDLLTLRAVKALQRADAVLFDALVDPSILDLARPGARRIDVGKRCGRHAMTQAAINRLIVSLARSGAQVVRLKGGDPSLFGRGGEELDCLRAAGVPVEVVPGVTAACAAAAGLRVSLTHRDVARSVHFITGHGSDGQVPAHDWRALAASGGTIAAYMAAKTLRQVATSLIEAGLCPTTPAVAVTNASRRLQTHVHATLARLPDLLAANPPAGPTLVLIGAVVGHAQAIPDNAIADFDGLAA